MRNTGYRHLLALALLLTANIGSAAAKDEDTAVRKAEELYREARALMAQARFAEACPRLVESQRLDAGIGTLLTLGECYEASGDLPAAASAFSDAEREATQRMDRRSKLASERLTRILPKVGRVRLLIGNGNLEPSTAIAIDGAPFESSSLGKTMHVAPGAHVIEVRAKGKRDWSITVTTEAGTAVLDVQIPELVAEPPAPVQPSSLETASDSMNHSAIATSAGQRSASAGTVQVVQDSATGNRQRTQRLAAYAVGGIGLVGAGVGSWLLLAGQSKEADAAKFCNPEDQSRCTQKGVDLIHEAQRLDTTGGVVLGVGIAGLVAGAILYVTAPSTQSHSQHASLALQPLLLPGSAGVSLRGRY